MRLNQHLVGHLLRKTKLLPLVWRAMFVVNVVKHYRANQQFRREHPDFTVPPLALAYEAYNSVSYERYHRTGIAGARLIFDYLRPHMPDGPLSICDWGCGSGRIVRHMPTIDPGRLITAYGSDYNSRAIAWCQKNIDNVTFRSNAVAPPLAFQPDQFDAIYSMSVFTHMPRELQRPWIEENLRVVKPGGLVFLSTHGDAYTYRLLPHEREQYEQHGQVERGGVKAGWSLFTTYHNPRCIQETLFGDVEIVSRELFPLHSEKQDIWVLRKNCP